MLRQGILDQNGADDVQVWQRENHGGHVMSLVAIYRDAGVFGMHGYSREVIERGIEAFVVLGAKDELMEVQMMNRELKGLGWVGAVKVIEGAGHLVVREKAEVVAEPADNFWNGLEEE
jgi:pimeloyl-ACP methyl ester carboxylesterase